ncbi:MAG: HDIG domain-containing metalloprotein [Methanoregula sp.]
MMPAILPQIMERSAAISLLCQYVHGDGLKKHCLATGAIMRALAARLGEDAEVWETIGILHDIDFELIDGDMQLHGAKGATILKEHGIDPDLVRIVRRHNHQLFAGTYNRPVEIALQASDSVSGLVIACALVKGGRLSLVTGKTVTKKAKEKSFASGCDRSRIALIAPILALPDFYAVAIDGLMEIRGELGLT